jgi:hypothetical protein
VYFNFEMRFGQPFPHLDPFLGQLKLLFLSLERSG